MRVLFLLLIGLLWGVGWPAMADGGIAVIAHPAMPKTDQVTLQRLYTGRIVSISQQAAMPLNLPPGDPVRKQFLDAVLGQTEEQYVGYWLVRRYVGKGRRRRSLARLRKCSATSARRRGPSGMFLHRKSRWGQT